jgi:transcriptional regulator with GAF, ATPase, and Fis domain
MFNAGRHKGNTMKAIEQVTLFYEISNALNEHLDLKKSMYKVLDILSNSMQMERGTISILNPSEKRDQHRGGSQPVQERHGAGEIQAGRGDHRPGD